MPNVAGSLGDKCFRDVGHNHCGARRCSIDYSFSEKKHSISAKDQVMYDQQASSIRYSCNGSKMTSPKSERIVRLKKSKRTVGISEKLKDTALRIPSLNEITQ